jgi:hypothetical protein
VNSLKRFSLFLSTMLALTAFLVLPASWAFAQSSVATQPAQKHSLLQQLTPPPPAEPFCYGDGLPHSNPPVPACDGKSHSSCHSILENTKAIGSQSQGQIGTLKLYWSGSDPQTECNSWWGTVSITHSGCYNVSYVIAVETTVDGSQAEADNGNVCNGQSFSSPMVGDFQPGGCYYAASDTIAGTDQFTTTVTYCQ